MGNPNDSIYFYNPSLGAAILFAILFIPPFAWHVWSVFFAPRTHGYVRTRYYIPLLIGAALEVAGYGVRCGSVKTPSDVGLYATSSSFVVIAPAFICASLYLLMKRLILATNAKTGDGKSQRIVGISPRWLPRIFVASDCFSLMTQSSGSAIASSNGWQGTQMDIGINVLIAGLSLQVFTLLLFTVIIIVFHRKNRPIEERGVFMVIKGLYIGVFFIFMRSVYRVAEFTDGIPSYTFNNEWPTYVLEALPMFVGLNVLAWYHPGRWLPLSPSATTSPSQGMDLEASRR